MANKFICNKCNYKTNRKFNYSKHLSTQKHIDKNATFNEKNKIVYRTKRIEYDDYIVTTDEISSKNRHFKNNSLK